MATKSNTSYSKKLALAGLSAAAAFGATSLAHSDVQADTYTIKSGDTLSEIAQEFNTTVDTLAQLNHIANPHFILAGQTIELGDGQLPAQAPVQEAAPAEDVASSAAASAEAAQETAPAQDMGAATATSEAPAQEVEASSEVVEDTSLASQEEPNQAQVAQEAQEVQEASADQANQDQAQEQEADSQAPEETPASSDTASSEVSPEEAPAPVSDAAATSEAPAEQAPEQAQEAAPAQEVAPAASGYTSNLSAADAAAKEELAQRESGGSYTASNGQYYGRYQLTRDYLNNDLSEENQERTADAYVAGRYGSWSAALAYWNANGWY